MERGSYHNLPRKTLTVTQSASKCITQASSINISANSSIVAAIVRPLEKIRALPIIVANWVFDRLQLVARYATVDPFEFKQIVDGINVLIVFTDLLRIRRHVFLVIATEIRGTIRYGRRVNIGVAWEIILIVADWIVHRQSYRGRWRGPGRGREQLSSR